MKNFLVPVLSGCLLSVMSVSPAVSGLFDDSLFGHSDAWIEASEKPERIETDRHDFTHTPISVGRGVTQFEYGYMYLYKDQNDEIEHTHVTPEMKVRCGITDTLEFHLRWNYAWRFIDNTSDGEDEVEEEADDRDGAEDLRIGFKWELSEEEGWHPESAIEVHITAPTGGKAWSTDKVEPSVSYLYQWDLDEIFSLAGSTGYASNGAGDVSLFKSEEGETDNFNVWFQSVSVGAELTENSTAYLEWFGLFSDGLEKEFSQNFINIGVDIFLSEDVVIDFRIGQGLTDDSDDLFVGVGGGVRY